MSLSGTTSTSASHSPAIDLHKSVHAVSTRQRRGLAVFGPADHRLTGRTERSGHVHLDLARSELDSLWNSDREQAVLETRFDPLGLELAA
jgi:hypothetical protein